MECDPDVATLLARSDIDAVFISTPHAQHAAQAVMALKSGKHVLLDKPMAATVVACDRINAAASEAGLNVMIMFGQRFRKINLKAYQLIQEGAIGRITQIHSYALNSGGLASLPPWQSEPENLGTLFGHGIHNLDQIRWLTGDEVVSVSAQVQRQPPSKNEVATMAVLGMSDGAMATVWVSWTVPLPGFPHSAFSARVVGERGILDLDAYGVLRLGRERRWTVVAEQEPIDFKGKGMLDPVRLEAYAAQGDEFLNSIREKGRPVGYWRRRTCRRPDCARRVSFC